MTLVSAGCGSGGEQGAGGGGGTSAPTTGEPAGGTGPTRYEATGTVLEAPGRGPELCLGAVAESFPPQCRGVPLAGWDWGAVEREQSHAGTTWGEFRVTGTFDGSRFTVTGPATPAAARPSFGGLRTPCPEPHNGYLDRVPAQATPERLAQAISLARAEPTLGGLWIDDPRQPRSDGSVRQGDTVLNATFTADVDARRAELEAAWGGFVCVTRAARTLAALQQIQAEVMASPPAGTDVLATWVAEHENAVRLEVVLAPPGTQQALDGRFGPGAVKVDSALRPVG